MNSAVNGVKDNLLKWGHMYQEAMINMRSLLYRLKMKPKTSDNTLAKKVDGVSTYFNVHDYDSKGRGLKGKFVYIFDSFFNQSQTSMCMR